MALSLSPRISLSFLILVCFLILSCSYFMETVVGVQPCQLCLYERYTFVVAGIIAVLGLLFIPQKKLSLALLGTGVIFLFGFFLASYHVAVQQHWVALPAFCTPPQIIAGASIEEIRNQLMNTSVVRCDVISWSLFGISITLYNSLVSLALAFFSLWAFMKNN